MMRLVVKNRHQTKTCYGEIGLCAKKKDIILGAIVNIIGMLPKEKEESSLRTLLLLFLHVNSNFVN